VVALDSVWKNVAGLAAVAVRSFLGTVAVLLAAGLALAGCASYLLREHPAYGLVVGAVALAEALAAGVLLGGKRALVTALAHGLRSLRLGRSAVRLLFGRGLGVSPEQEFGGRGGRVVQGVERLPLAQAEQRLGDAVRALLSAPPSGGGLTGWFRRRLQAGLLGRVQGDTLARFREEGARHGGGDLLRGQADLEGRIGDLLLGWVRAGLNLWTALVVVGLPALVLAQSYVVLALLK